MIRRLIPVAAFALMGLLVLACGKKDEDVAVSVVGNWMYVGTTSTALVYTQIPENSSNIYVFESGNNLTVARLLNGSKLTGTFSTTGTSLSWTLAGGTSAFQIESRVGDDLVLLDPNPTKSLVKSRHYHRISDSTKDALYKKYNVK